MFIDETAELTAIYDQDQDRGGDDEDGLDLDIDPGPESSSYQRDRQRAQDVSAFQHPSSGAYRSRDVAGNPPDPGGSNALQSRNEEWQSRPETGSVIESSTQEQVGSFPDFWESHTSLSILSPVQSRITDVETPNSPFLDGLVKKPSSIQPAHTALEVLLLRYFIEVLARWFDLCDPEKHFELVVPQRARSCPPLRNAMLAASARHLTRVPQNVEVGLDTVYYYQGRPVADLTEETALRYHSECIKDLLKRSLDPHQTRDENLLAAAIILRFYEEIDAPLRDDDRDNELFLRVINVFINAQIPSVPLVPHSSPIINGPRVGCIDGRYEAMPASPEVIQSPTASEATAHSQALLGSSVEAPAGRWRTDGLCQAGFWVAFRQEIYSAFVKQRPINHDLGRCEAFRSFSPAEDAVWADRLIVFCADVLEYCYGNSNNSSSSSGNTAGAGTGTRSRHDSSSSSTLPLSASPAARDHWLSLKQQESMWAQVLPSSFEPLYFRDPDRSRGEIFPTICYLSDCHVAGVQHVELAKILLAVYDPTRARLGPGHVAGMRALSRELRTIVLRLCGIATSNRNSPPGLVTALLAIVVCGDHFEDPLEQQAVLGILDELEGLHAWPAGNTRTLLKEAWGTV